MNFYFGDQTKPDRNCNPDPPIESEMVWTEWEPRPCEKSTVLHSRDQCVEKLKEYVEGVRSGASQFRTTKGLKICVTVGIMGMGKTVCSDLLFT